MSADLPTGADGAGSSATATAEQYLTFALERELYAIPIIAVREIRGFEPVSRIPRSPEHVLGVMNLRGTVVPVIDLRARLSIARCERTATTVVIVVRLAAAAGAEQTVGCVVDGVSDVVHVAASAVRPPPEVCGHIDGHYLRGLVDIDARLVQLLDLPRLIGTAVGAPPAARDAA